MLIQSTELKIDTSISNIIHESNAVEYIVSKYLVFI